MYQTLIVMVNLLIALSLGPTGKVLLLAAAVLPCQLYHIHFL